MTGEDASAAVLPGLLGALMLCLIGLEVERKRIKLRRIYDVLDDQECQLVGVLDGLVRDGEVRTFGQHHMIESA